MKEYSEILGNVRKEQFSPCINRLLNRCFLVKSYAETSADYRFVLANRELFEGILDLLGYELLVREEQGVIGIQNTTGLGRVRFTKAESILLLILRLLYIEKMKELSQTDETIVILDDVYEKYGMLKIGKLRTDVLAAALRRFVRFNLIRNLDRVDTGDPESRIRILPSILFAVTSSGLDEVYRQAQEKLNAYGEGGDGNDSDESDEENDDENPSD